MKLKKWLSMLLAAVMLLSLLPVSALAAAEWTVPGQEPSGLKGFVGLTGGRSLANGTGTAPAGKYLMKFQAYGSANTVDYYGMSVSVYDANGNLLGLFEPSAYGTGEDGTNPWGVKEIPANFEAAPAQITISCHYQVLGAWEDPEQLTYTAPFPACCVNQYASGNRISEPDESVTFCIYSIECQEDGAAVSYIDANGIGYIQENCASLDYTDGDLSEGWYAVRNSARFNSFSVSGDVNLVLCDNRTLEVKETLAIHENSSLTIWCQSGGSGALSAEGYLVVGSYYGPGIYVPASSSLTINGGNITAKGEINCAGIGGGNDTVVFLPESGSITINGGTVTAYGGADDDLYTANGGGAGIGAGSCYYKGAKIGPDVTGACGPVTINGGNVKALGGALAEDRTTLLSEAASGGTTVLKERARGSGAGIGGTYMSQAPAEIRITGGTVEAVGGDGAAGIGGGRWSDSGPITITGGEVTARSSADYLNHPGAAIGGGESGTNGPITITGGKVTAKTTNPPEPWDDEQYKWYKDRNHAAAIGSGEGKGQTGKITISGGTVIAITPGVGAGIGGATDGGEIEISGDDTVVIASSVCGAGIGGGGASPGVSSDSIRAYGGDITIHSGTVLGLSAFGGAGIGTGISGIGGTITINGGYVLGYGGSDHYSWYDESARSPIFNSVGISDFLTEPGGFMDLADGTLEDWIISLIFDRDYSGAGIGCGDGGKGGIIAINGGTVIAKAGDNTSMAIGKSNKTETPPSVSVYNYSKVTYGSVRTTPVMGGEDNLEIVGYLGDIIEIGSDSYTFNPPDDDRVEKVTSYSCAIIEPGKILVSFDVAGHGTAPEDQIILNGEYATRPENDPEEEGWIFDDWYTDDSYSTPFNFSKPVTKPTVIYGKWSQKYDVTIQKLWPEGADKPDSVTFSYQNQLTAETQEFGTLTLNDANNWSAVITLSETGILTLSETVPTGFFFGGGALTGIADAPIALPADGNSITFAPGTLNLSADQWSALLNGSGTVQLSNAKARIYTAEAVWDIPMANYKPTSITAVLQNYNGSVWETVETVTLNESSGYTASFTPILETPGIDDIYRIRELDKNDTVVLDSGDEGGSATPTATFHIYPWSYTEMDMDYEVSYNADADGKTVITNRAGKYFYVRIEWENIEDDTDKPESVTVDLMADTALVDFVTLSDENNWEAVFKGQMEDSRYWIRENDEDGSTVYIEGDQRPSFDTQRPNNITFYTITRNGKTRTVSYDVALKVSEDGRSTVITNTKSGLIYSARNVWNVPENSPWPQRIYTVRAVLQQRTTDEQGNEVWTDLETIELSNNVVDMKGKFNPAPIGNGFSEDDYRVREFVMYQDVTLYIKTRIDPDLDNVTDNGRLMLLPDDADNLSGKAPRYICEYISDYYNHTVEDTVGFTVSYDRDENGNFIITNTQEREPEFKAHSLLLSSEIGVRFRVSFPDYFEPADCHVDFVAADGRTSTMAYADSEAISGSTDRYFVFNINALELAENITATLYNGGTVISTDEYSAMAYIQYVQDNITDNQKLLYIVNALHAYGYYMQGSGWTDKLSPHTPIPAPAAALTEDDIPAAAAAVSGYVKTEKFGDSGIVSSTFSLTLNAHTVINISVKPGEGTTITSGEYQEIQRDDGTWYQFSTVKIGPKNLGKDYTVTVQTDQGTATVSASAMAYVRSILESDAFNDVQKLAMTAYYYYYEAADNY